MSTAPSGRLAARSWSCWFASSWFVTPRRPSRLEVQLRRPRPIWPPSGQILVLLVASSWFVTPGVLRDSKCNCAGLGRSGCLAARSWSCWFASSWFVTPGVLRDSKCNCAGLGRSGRLAARSWSCWFASSWFVTPGVLRDSKCNCAEPRPIWPPSGQILVLLVCVVVVRHARRPSRLEVQLRRPRRFLCGDSSCLPIVIWSSKTDGASRAALRAAVH